MLGNERINGGDKSANGAIASESVAVGVRNESSSVTSERGENASKGVATSPDANQTKTKKIISIYNVKGGVGKSTIARELAYKLNATLVDCDKGGVQEYMESVRVVKIGEDNEIPQDIEGEVIIYDFPGKDDERREEAAKASDVVIIPYTPSFYALQSTADSYRQILKSNRCVIMIANMLKDDKDLARTKDELEDFLNQHSDVGDIIVQPLHYTRGLQSAENNGKSIYQIRDSSPFNRMNYEKTCRELDAIVDTVERLINVGA
jgi:cellulose biosynthesis protein BcsQ